MTLLNLMRRTAATFGLEVVRANAFTVWRRRLPALLQRQGFTCVIDVGANDGGFASELIQNRYYGTVVSFEPLLKPWESLATRAARVPGNRWRVAPPLALSDKEGTANFFEAGNTVSSSLLRISDRHVDAAYDSSTIARHSVRTAKLDDIINEIVDDHHTDIYLKVDVQGAERLVLEGARESLQGRIRGVQLEMSLDHLYEGQANSYELDDLLRSLGFALWDIVPGFRDPRSLQLLQYDGIYIRRP